MTKLNPNPVGFFLRERTHAKRFSRVLRQSAPVVIAIASFILLELSAVGQQTVNVQSQPVRVTVADLESTVTILTNNLIIGGGSNQVDLSVAGLPSGASASYTVSAFTNSGGTTLSVNTTNVAKGEYVLNLNATGGAQNTFLLTLQSGRMWTNVVGNWSAGGSWIGGIAPGASDDVLFTQLGAQSSATVTNSTVDVSKEIASLRFSQTNGTSRYHNLQINPGVTLSVTGNKGLRLLRDFTGVGAQMDVNIRGEGALVVSNANANIAVTIDNQQSHRFDLSGLNTFIADVNRIGFGDYRMYPNYTNLTANGFSGNAAFLIPRRFIPSIRLARTNIIRAVYADPNNYTNAGIRDYSLTFENNDIGTTADGSLWFGITNAFFLDSICLVQSSAQAEVANEIVFNSAFAGDNPVAYFRGTNGGRMSVFAIADAAGVGPSGTSTKALVDFSRGAVDALVDRLYLGRDRTNSSDNASAEATLTLAQGTFDANIAILGFQDNGNNLNVGGANPTGYARGTVNVNTNAIFVVHDSLQLGFTSADSGDIRQAELGFGRLSINNSGVVMANDISVGGITKLTVANSAQNTITITGNGDLIVTNSIASADARLGTLTMSGSATLTFPSVTVANTNAYVQNFVASGGVIRLLSVPAAGQYPLISYTSASASLILSLPPGFYGYLINNTANQTIDAIVSTTPPKTVIWRGNIGGNWDTSTFNWIDANSLTATNFNNGDAAVFDDSATGNTTVTVVGTVVPAAGTTISNSVLDYTFTGGSISGTAATVKNGSKTVTMDATHEPSITVNSGSLIVTASGSLKGGVASSGLLSNNGSISGSVSIQAGTFINAATVSTAPGSMVIAAGVMVTNTGTINAAGGTWSIPSGSTLVNLGTINNLVGRLNIGGTMIGTGIVHDSTTPEVNGVGRLAINNGGLLTVGDAIGTMSVEGRLDLDNGSTTVIKVDFSNPVTNDWITLDYAGNLQTTFLMTNINPAAGSFSNGQTFTVMAGNFGVTLTNGNAAHIPKVSPAVPGIGLQWDAVSGMKITNSVRTLFVTKVPSAPPVLTSASSGGTNVTLSWASTNLGYQLQVQTNSLDVGLSTNWIPISGSENTNSWSVPIDPVNGSVFYRLSDH